MKKITAILSTIAIALSLAFIPIKANTGNVAKIGDVEYATLAEAIENVEAGQTIDILRDVDDAEGIIVESGKYFTVNFNGHVYTLKGPGAGSTGTETNGFQLLKDSTIFFKNGTINVAKDANQIRMMIQNYANLTLEDMTIDPRNKLSAGTAHNEDYALSINNGTVTITGRTTFLASNSDVISFDICQFRDYPSVKVRFDGNFMGEIQGKIYYDSTNPETHTLEEYGVGTLGKVEASSEEAKKASLEAIKLYGHFFTSFDALDYMHKSKYDGEDGDYKYITLVEDVTESVTINKDQAIAIRLEGHKITNEAGQHTITNYGKLHIGGSGIIDNVSHERAALMNYGNVEIFDAEFTRSKEAGISPQDSGGNSYYVINNEEGGYINNFGAKVHANGKFSSLIRNNGKLEIWDGEYTNGFIVVKNEEKGDLTIGDGVFTGPQTVQTFGKTKTVGGVYNGQFTVINYEKFPSETRFLYGDFNGDIVGMLYSEDATVNMTFENGPRVNGKIRLVNKNKEEISESELINVDVTSGIYTNDVSKYLMDKVLYLNIDGYYCACNESDFRELLTYAKKSVEVFKGVQYLTEVPEGVKVKNSTGDDLFVNGRLLEDGKELSARVQLDSTDLINFLSNMVDVNPKDYTPESWKPFSLAMGQARGILADPATTQDDVDAILKTLKELKGALVPVGSDVPTEPTEPSKPDGQGGSDKTDTETPKTADNSFVYMFVLMVALSGAILLVMKMKDAYSKLNRG